MVAPASHGIPRAPCYSRSASPAGRPSPTGLSPSVAPRSSGIRLTFPAQGDAPQRVPSRLTTPTLQRLRAITQCGFGLFPFRSPLLRESHSISFPRGTEMFHFPRLPSRSYGLTAGSLPSPAGGLPHSEIPGSTPACGSPGHIGAGPVLHRLLAPRHPPCALLA